VRNPLMAYHPVMAPADWYWLGGRPALDFVNTRRERWRRNYETLSTPSDLTEWLRRAELLAAPVAASPQMLAAAVALREVVDAGVRAVVAGEAPPAEAVAAIDGWLPYAATRPVLRPGAGGLPELGERPGAEPLAAALGAVALDAARMLGYEDDRRRVRICSSPTCSARFYDRSPAARRRWCSMTACGNAAKARRHRARQKEIA
jgi:predicted RNA-binding Zn ribbon-like protein